LQGYRCQLKTVWQEYRATTGARGQLETSSVQITSELLDPRGYCIRTIAPQVALNDLPHANARRIALSHGAGSLVICVRAKAIPDASFGGDVPMPDARHLIAECPCKDAQARRGGVLRGSAGARESKTAARGLRRPMVYFDRLHTTTAGAPPTEGVGWVYLSSSPVIVRLVRF
jgi:hypothetical protein